jgi:hypothetical protein
MSTNFHYLMSAFPNDNIDPKALENECAAVTTEHPSLTYDDVSVDITFDLVVPTQAQIDAIVAAHQGHGDLLAVVKRKKVIAIDDRTDVLIGLGFEFPPGSGMMFSLSKSGQLTMLGMDQLRDDPNFSYPVNYNSKNDDGVVALVNSAMVHNFFLSAAGTLRYRLDSGTVIKDEVRDATTVAEVEAIVDPR